SPDADSFMTAEFIVLEVDVVNDLRNGAESRIFGPDTIEQYFKRAFVALVCKLSLEHVEAQLTFVWAIALARNELEARIWVDQTADQPRAPDPIDMYALPRNPGFVAQRCKRWLRIDFHTLYHRLILSQPRL